MTSASSYIRGEILSQLRRDGYAQKRGRRLMAILPNLKCHPPVLPGKQSRARTAPGGVQSLAMPPGRPIPRNASRTETFEISKGASMPINSKDVP
jgi:hypothetical protein